MNKESLIVFLSIWILCYIAVAEIKNNVTRAEVKEALALVKKANALCKEDK